MSKLNPHPFYESQPKSAATFRACSNLNMVFPPHFHGELELFLIRSGSAFVTVDGQTQKLNAGDLAVIYPNVIHSYHSSSEGDYGFTIVICGAAFLGGLFSRLTHEHPVFPFVRKASLHPDVPYAMDGLVRQVEDHPDEEIYRAMMRLILARLFPVIKTEPIKEPASLDLISTLVQYLGQNFQHPLTLEGVAKELGVSKYYLSHIFSARLQTSFNEYINFLRIKMAQEMLVTTDQSILEIGMTCGFSSQRTFNRTFHEHTSLSPREYRKERKL